MIRDCLTMTFLRIFLALALQCLLGDAVRPGNYITILYEGGDSIVLPLVQNFNVSYLFYKEEYGLDDEINLERFDIPRNGTAKRTFGHRYC